MNEEIKRLLAELDIAIALHEDCEKAQASAWMEVSKVKHELRAELSRLDIHEEAFRIGNTVYVVDNDMDTLQVDIINAVEIRT